MTTPYVGQVLGEFVAASRWQDISPALRQEGLRSILNHIGCALGVARDPAVTTALKVMRLTAGPATSTVFGQGVKLDTMSAAFVNCIAGNLLDYDDTHLQTVIHPTAPVAPAALALAEQRGFSGAQVLHAFLLGAEVECRIGNAVSPGHYARGWHITSTCGGFGSALLRGGSRFRNELEWRGQRVCGRFGKGVVFFKQRGNGGGGGLDIRLGRRGSNGENGGHDRRGGGNRGEQLIHRGGHCRRAGRRLGGEALDGIEEGFVRAAADRIARGGRQGVFRQRADEGDRQAVAHGRVDRGPEEHVGSFGHEFLQALHEQFDFVKGEVLAAAEVDEDGLGVLEQGALV